MILISGEDYVKLKVVFIDAIFCIQSASVKSNDFFNFSSKVVLHKIPDLTHRMSIGVLVFTLHVPKVGGIILTKISAL